MFSVNSALTGETYEYDGNPQTFGDVNFSRKQRERTNEFARKFANKFGDAPAEVPVPAVAAMFSTAAGQETQPAPYAPSVAAFFSAAAMEEKVIQPTVEVDTVAAFFKAAAQQNHGLSPTSVDFDVEHEQTQHNKIPNNVAAFFSAAAAYEQPAYEQPQLQWQNGLLVPA
jgi:hypothetical protein